MSTKHIPKFTSERFVLPKTCPSTITLTFPPLKYTAMFQKLLFSHIKMSFIFVFWNILEFIFDLNMFSNVYVLYVFMRSNICSTMLYIWNITNYAHKYICQFMSKRTLTQTMKTYDHSFFNTSCVVTQTLTCKRTKCVTTSPSPEPFYVVCRRVLAVLQHPSKGWQGQN